MDLEKDFLRSVLNRVLIFLLELRVVFEGFGINEDRASSFDPIVANRIEVALPVSKQRHWGQSIPDFNVPWPFKCKASLLFAYLYERHIVFLEVDFASDRHEGQHLHLDLSTDSYSDSSFLFVHLILNLYVLLLLIEDPALHFFESWVSFEHLLILLFVFPKLCL